MQEVDDNKRALLRELGDELMQRRGSTSSSSGENREIERKLRKIDERWKRLEELIRARWVTSWVPSGVRGEI